MGELSSLIKLVDEVSIRLKSIYRTGWRRSGISISESVAEHVMHAQMFILLFHRLMGGGFDLGRALSLCLLHDSTEAYLGDIAKPDKDKYFERVEDRVHEWIASSLIPGYRGDGAGNGIEEAVVKLSDLIATASQGIYYLKLGYRSEYLNRIIINSLDEASRIASSHGLNLVKQIIDHYIDKYNEYSGL